MKWFYMIRGDASRHGVADGNALAEMARRGQIGPDDLVWNQENGADWLRAGSVPGLLPEIAPAPVSPPKAAIPVQAPPAAEDQPAPSRLHVPRWLWIVLAVLFFILLFVAVKWLPPGLK